MSACYISKPTDDEKRINRFKQKCRILEEKKQGIVDHWSKRQQILDSAFQEFNFSDEPIERYYKLGSFMGKFSGNLSLHVQRQLS